MKIGAGGGEICHVIVTQHLPKKKTVIYYFLHLSFRKLITEGVDPEQNEELETLSKKKKPAATFLKLSQTKTKGKGGEGQKINAGSTRFQTRVYKA